MREAPNHGPRSRPQRPMFDQENQGSGPSSSVPPANGAYPERLGADAPRPPSGGRGRPPRRNGSGGGGRRRASRGKRVAQVVALVLGLLLVSLVVVAVIYYSQIDHEIQSDSNQVVPMPEEIRTEAIPEYKGKNLVAFLILGVDYNNDTADGFIDESNKYGNTDLIMYVLYNTKTGKANVLQIPRDTFVGEDLASVTGGLCKINGLYPHSPDPGNRVAALANVIYDQLKLPIDFYVTLDMDAVKAIVGHMGSIQVYVPQEVTDEGTGNLLINQGWVDITDQEVEYLVRNRNYPDGDATRLRTQLSLYSALFREFSQLAPGDLVMWMRILVYYVKVGGISTWDLGGLAQSALGLSGENVTFVRPAYSGAWFTPAMGQYEGKRQSLICLVPEDMANLLNEYFRPEGGEVPPEELGIATLPVNEYGTGEAEVRTMASVQADEPEKPAS